MAETNETKMLGQNLVDLNGLSAFWGKVKQNISSEFLKLSGGTMTGDITLGNSNAGKGIIFNGTDTDRSLIRINSTTDKDQGTEAKSNYGFTIKFLGSGSGVNNAFALYGDNQTATEQVLATKWLNDGTMYSRGILPHTNKTYDLGSSSYRWNNIYVQSLSTGTVLPYTNNTYYLGNETYKYAGGYFNTVYANTLKGSLNADYFKFYSDDYVIAGNSSPFSTIIDNKCLNAFADCLPSDYTIGDWTGKEVKLERWSGALGEDAVWEDCTDAEAENITDIFSSMDDNGNIRVKYSPDGNVVVGDKIRITILPYSKYCTLAYVWAWFSTSGHTNKITIEKNNYDKTNKVPNDNWEILHDKVAISGWSNANTYGINKVLGQTNNEQGYGIRITIEVTEVSESFIGTSPTLYKLKGFTNGSNYGMNGRNTYFVSQTGRPYKLYKTYMSFDRTILPKTNYLNLGNVDKSWNDIYSKNVYIKGTNSSNALISADTATNMYMKVNNKIPFVIDAADATNIAIRPGSSMTDPVHLGTSNIKWGNVYANKFVGSLEGNADSATTATKVNNSLNIRTSTSYGHNGTTDVTFNGASSRTLTINTGTTIYGVYDGNKINITSTSSEHLPISSCNLINSGGPASNTIDAYTNVFIKFTNGITKTDKNNPSIYLVINVNGGTGGNTLFNILNPLNFLGENISEGTVLQFITLHSGNIGQRISVLYVGHHANNPLLVNSITANDVIHTPTNGSINLGYIGPKVISASTDFSTNAYVPNKYHQINYAGTTYESKTIKLASPTNTTVVNEYLFEIVVPSVGVSVNFADENGSSLNIKWADRISPDWEPDCTYQVSIVNNLGTFLKFK